MICVRCNIRLLLLDMNRPSFHPDDSSAYDFRHQNVSPWQNNFRGFVSYPTRYYSRPPRPTDHSTSAVRSGVPHRPTSTKPRPDFQTDFSNSFLKSSVQQKTFDNAVKENASEEHVDDSMLAISAGTADHVEQLKWQPGQGPIVDLRLLVPGRVCLLI